MQYNNGYRKRSRVANASGPRLHYLNQTIPSLAEAPIVEPWPGSVAGARSQVERFEALKLLGTEGVGGGSAPAGSVTSLTPLPPKKSKRIADYTYEFLREDCHCDTFVAAHWREKQKPDEEFKSTATEEWLFVWRAK